MADTRPKDAPDAPLDLTDYYFCVDKQGQPSFERVSKAVMKESLGIERFAYATFDRQGDLVDGRMEDFTISCTRLDTGIYRIVHNLGRLDYNIQAITGNNSVLSSITSVSYNIRTSNNVDMICQDNSGSFADPEFLTVRISY